MWEQKDLTHLFSNRIGAYSVLWQASSKPFRARGPQKSQSDVIVQAPRGATDYRR